MIPLAILLPITVVVRVSHGWYEVLLLDLPFFAAATFSVVMFYAGSQARAGARLVGAGEVPAARDGARHRPLGEPGARRRRGAHGVRDRLHPHAQARREGRGRVGRAQALQGGAHVPAARRARARRLHDLRRRLPDRARGLLLAAVPRAVPGRLRLRRPRERVRGAARHGAALVQGAAPAAVRRTSAGRA